MASIVGLDIGSTGIRAVEVSKRGSSLVTHRAAAIPLREDLVHPSGIGNVAAVTDALVTLWRKGRFTTRRCAVALTGDRNVLVRSTQIMYLDNPVLFRAMVAESAKEALPVPVDEVYLDHHVLSIEDSPTADNPAQRSAEVLLVGAKRALVDDVVEALEGARLVPQRIDVASAALTRLVTQAHNGTSSLEAIVHMGAESVLLTIVVDGQMRAMHSLAEFAGRAVTAQTQETFDLTRENAERTKLHASADMVAGVDSDAIEVLNAAMSSLCGEVRSLIGTEARRFERRLDQVWLSGGGAHIGNLPARLGAELGVKASIIDPRLWTVTPAKLDAALQTGQDLTLAMAAGGN